MGCLADINNSTINTGHGHDSSKIVKRKEKVIILSETLNNSL